MAPNEREFTHDPLDDVMSATHILHGHLAHPEDILRCDLLDAREKRSILASWASDRYAVESIPQLPAAVRYRNIVDALKKLDRRPTP
ncbi:hypothetical protein HJB88_12210 [Rhizobium sp. NZLR5]|uniref:hypothetical protein n=1 Tax=unclassified Rhizobium TaxID=2613769 RepID=UPI001C83AC5C|nr:MULTISPECIES: hypothetical protein [unclassified Rhizobium]MBX5183400.1 hypothetical protein [Rhizobium sp. NZLR5]MBX5198315.1 hypothetical protein [Rhizobium sp. NZLR10]